MVDRKLADLFEQSAKELRAANNERKPPKRRASEAGVNVPESADVDTVVEQLKKRFGKIGKAKSRSGHDFGKTEKTSKSRQHSAPPCPR